MAPINKIRTYSRSAKSLVHNSIDAGKLLFQNKKAKQRRKPKLLIKELPARTDSKELFHQDSFQVSTEDTFDKLLKGNIYNPVNIKSQISIVHSSDTDVSKSIKKVNSIYSPIITKRKKQSASVTEVRNNLSSNSKRDKSDDSKLIKKVNYFSPIMTRSKKRSALTVDSSNSLDSVTGNNKINSLLPRFNEPSSERIDFSLEIEKVREPVLNSLSYIVIPKHKVSDVSISANEKNSSKTKELSFDPIFTKTFREKQLIHSSTPLAPLKSKRIINYTISPIKNISGLENSVTTEQSGRSNFNNTKNSRILKPINSTNIEYLPEQDWKLVSDPKVMLTNFVGFDSKEMSESKKMLQSFQNIFEKENFNVTHSPAMPTVQRGNLCRDSFITLRKRKILKNSIIKSKKKTLKSKTEELTSKNNFQTESKSINLEVSDFIEKTRAENTSEFSSDVTQSLSTFTGIDEQKKEPVNLSNTKDSFCGFVNKRRLTDSFLVSTKKRKTSTNAAGNKKASRRFSYQEFSIVKQPMVELRDLIVLLPRVHSSVPSKESETSSSYMGNQYNLSETDTSTTGSSQVSENDFFRLKHPIFKEFSVNLSRLPHNEQFSSNKTDSCVEYLPETSKSLFQSDTVENKSIEFVCTLHQSLRSDANTSVSVNSSNSSIEMVQDVSVSRDSVGQQVNSISSDNIRDSIEKFVGNSEELEKTFETLTKRSRSAKKSNSTQSLDEREVSCRITSFPSGFVDKNNLKKELIVNVIRSPWRKVKQSVQSNKTVTENTVIDLSSVLDEKEVRKSSAVSNISALRQSEVGQLEKSDISDIIETSVLESPPVDSDGFKMPGARKRQSKTVMLQAGKLWRRSLSMYKRSALMLNILGEDVCRLADGTFCMCPKCNIKKQFTRLSIRRNSIRIVPITPRGKACRDVSILENYAHNASYVSDRILEDNLEDDLRSLSLSKRKDSLVQDSQPVTARELVLKKCGQEEPLPFEECYPDSLLHHCQKIGEGVYGEVFLFRNPNGGTSVMKVIPIEGDQIVNGERQKKFEEILSEITIALELSNLRNKKQNKTYGFSEVQEVRCVQGRYPEKLLELWDLYDETRGSENDSPDIFEDDQLYIVLQLANGGSDLEAFVFNNSVQAYAMFQQVACALAVAEEELRFEHRDLHWGNVLLSVSDKNSKVAFRLDGRNYDIPTRGVEVAIIDFTLSRIECEGVVIFNDLSLDPDLFTAEGDYQFEIYKLMQTKNGNNWQRFEPYSNVLWLHYTLDKAVNALRYRNVQTKIHKEFLAKLGQLKEEILKYGSAKEFVLANF